jgi:hypothetical protein
MNKHWRVSLSGKIELVLFVYAALLVALFIELIWDLLDLAQLKSEDFIVLSPVLVIAGLIPIFFARKKKVPKLIQIEKGELIS